MLYGDINKDAKIAADDALLVLEHTVKLSELEKEILIVADVNGYKKIDDQLTIHFPPTRYSGLRPNQIYGFT